MMSRPVQQAKTIVVGHAVHISAQRTISGSLGTTHHRKMVDHHSLLVRVDITL